MEKENENGGKKKETKKNKAKRADKRIKRNIEH